MRHRFRVATISLAVWFVSCSSSKPAPDRNLRPGELDPNKHLQGSTGVLKDYRLPGGGKKSTQHPDFRAIPKDNQKKEFSK
jgi:hypothetical protein